MVSLIAIWGSPQQSARIKNQLVTAVQLISRIMNARAAGLVGISI